MKKQQIIFIVFILSLTTVFSQVRFANTTTNSAVASSSAFIDASSNTTFNGSTNIGKGLLFPQTDLTTFASFNVTGPLGASTNYPSFFDGMVVYNTATGNSSIGSVAVTPGFYYYSNPGQTFPGGSATAGTWTPLGSGGGGGGAVAVDDDTPTDSDLIINSNQEKVVRLTGTANGVSTHIDLGTTTLAANTVSTFRKAVVYDATSGHVILESTGAYDPATNIFVTGNGMMNVLLDTGAYDVELYYTE